jgi:hypothetical protein
MAGLRHTLRPVPPDFVELSAKHPGDWLIQHYRTSKRALIRWRKETGTTGRVMPTRAMPADFATRAPTMYLRHLANHYGAGTDTVKRWCEEAGVSTKPFDSSTLANSRWAAYRARKALEPKPASPRKPYRFNYAGPAPKPLPGRDWSIHGQAAEHLRRLAPVYRCWETGTANPKGDFFRFGNVILTPDELLQRAKAKGWEAAF